MRTIQTKAVILKRYKIGEADRLMLVFSEKLGKILVVAKSVRKIESKLAGHIEPYRLINLEVVRGEKFYRLTGALDTLPNHLGAGLSLELFRHLELLGETIDLTLGEEEPQTKTFEIFAQGIEKIVNHPQDFLILTLEILLKLLSSIGLKPELNLCTKCARQLEDKVNAWSSLDGGVVCALCLDNLEQPRIIKSNQSISLMRLLLNIPLAESLKISKLKKTVVSEVKDLLSIYLTSHLPKNLKTLT